jgi:hypothetical protein
MAQGDDISAEMADLDLRRVVAALVERCDRLEEGEAKRADARAGA